MLTSLNVEGKLITADTMHCKRETCRRVVQKKGDYLCTCGPLDFQDKSYYHEEDGRNANTPTESGALL